MFSGRTCLLPHFHSSAFSGWEFFFYCYIRVPKLGLVQNKWRHHTQNGCLCIYKTLVYFFLSLSIPLWCWLAWRLRRSCVFMCVRDYEMNEWFQWFNLENYGWNIPTSVELFSLSFSSYTRCGIWTWPCVSVCCYVPQQQQ